ncbi:YcfL family protein [Thaumasiovibrio subtropicus]|uniref:YcfL family protein n=1 Tax=Thaumasiovibrio subtropicus TaxID=1891207 RepID=UPI000B359D39|nr:YcfL family protein [Thaumasiovibrio subtropicus]
MKWIMAALMAVALVGCSQTSTGLSISSENQSVVIDDFDLGKRIEVERAAQGDVNGLIQARVPIKSVTDKTLKLQYRFYWYDGQGLELSGSDSPWLQAILYGKDRVTLQGMANDARATQYRVLIREAE